MMLRNCLLVLCAFFPLAAEVTAQDPGLTDRTRKAMHTATRYFVEDVAVNGGYVYFYSPDLSRRLGEGVASPTQIWVQPPGTPTVGLAMIDKLASQ